MGKKLFFSIALLLSASLFLVFTACDGSGGHDIMVNVSYTAEDTTATAYAILISGAVCANYQASDIVYKASGNMTEVSPARGVAVYDLSGTISMTGVKAGTYVACVFVDLDGLTGSSATTLASAEPENGDAITTSDLDVVLDGDKIYSLVDSDFTIMSDPL